MNSVQLTGRFTRDPEIRYTDGSVRKADRVQTLSAALHSEKQPNLSKSIFRKGKKWR